MSELRSRSWRFTPRSAPEAAQFVQESVAGHVYPHQARFLVHAPAETVQAQIPASAAAVRSIDEHRCEVFSGAADLDVVLAHVALLGHDFEVLEPTELIERAQQMAARLRRAGRPSGGTAYL
jgi:predicted DNA-binding transcriptional regulator YafY